MFIKKIFIIIFIIFSITSCRWITSAGTSNIAFTNIKVPPGTPKFQKGYKDGCATLLYARGYGPYRARYDFSLDPKLLDDSEYMFGRKRGYSFCFNYVVGGAGQFAGGWDQIIYGQGTPFDMGKGNIDDTLQYGNVFDSWGSSGGGVDGSIDLLQTNRVGGGSKTSVFGGHIFYGRNTGQILGW